MTPVRTPARQSPDRQSPVRLAVAPMTGATGPIDTTEQRSAAGMAPWRAREFLRGRGLLRGLVADVLAVPPRAVGFRVEPRGRPRLRDDPAGVSVSHTDTHVAAAIWPAGEVGVDVMEPPEELDSRLVRRCCGRFAGQVLSRPDAADCFARVWAVQEACVKAVGLGLGGLPWRIPVDPDARRGRWGDVRWQLVDTGLPCVLAVASRPVTQPTTPLATRAATQPMNQSMTRRTGEYPRVLVQHPG